MCDYSLQHVRSRAAQVGDKLTTRDFGTGTRGFSAPEDPTIATALQRYFPKPLRERFAAHIERHPLKREIVATHVVNSMVNRVGPTFAHRLHEETGAAQVDIVVRRPGPRETGRHAAPDRFRPARRPARRARCER